MANIRVAHRYAEALIGSAEEKKITDRIAGDLETLRKTARDSREFFLFLKSPVITREKKKEIIQEIFGNKLHPETLRFMALLAAKGREDILLLIIDEFFRLRNEKLGIVTVEVKSGVELVKEHGAELQRRFEGFTKKKVNISYSLDKQLKGGFIARIGDTVFDGSIKRQLELLREQFAEGTA